MNTDAISEQVAAATPTDWPALRCLFMAIAHACPDTLGAVVDRWPPEKAASSFSAAHPDYYASASWVFSGISKYRPVWCDEVGRSLDWDKISRNLGQVRRGDLDAVEECCSVLLRLHVPLRRSMIRRYGQVMRDVLQGARLHELHPGFGYDLSIVLQLFPAEVDALAAALDPVRLACELSVASPRHWRVLGELATFLRSTSSDVYERIVSQLERDKFVANVSAYGPSHPYELRCLLWLLRDGTEKAQKELAAKLFDTVATAAAACETERPTLLEAFSYLDHERAARIAAELKTELKRRRVIDDRPLQERFPAWRRTVEQLRVLDQTGGDYEVWPLAKESVDQVWADDVKAWDELPSD